jgi:hypothetical protein
MIVLVVAQNSRLRRLRFSLRVPWRTGPRRLHHSPSRARFRHSIESSYQLLHLLGGRSDVDLGLQ